jgi:hypothetical protein
VICSKKLFKISVEQTKGIQIKGSQEKCCQAKYSHKEDARGRYNLKHFCIHTYACMYLIDSTPLTINQGGGEGKLVLGCTY